MTTALLAVTTSKTDWYLMRGSGFVTLILLTATVAMGVVGFRRWESLGWPRGLTALLHRNLSLLACCFLGLHIVTALLDSWVGLSWYNVVLPFSSHWNPLWVGCGAITLDLLIAVMVTSMLRRRLHYRVWRAVHWLSWAMWPIAVTHALGAGTDSRSSWGLGIVLACVAVLGVATVLRLTGSRNVGSLRRPITTAASVSPSGASAAAMMMMAPTATPVAAPIVTSTPTPASRTLVGGRS